MFLVQQFSDKIETMLCKKIYFSLTTSTFSLKFDIFFELPSILFQASASKMEFEPNFIDSSKLDREKNLKLSRFIERMSPLYGSSRKLIARRYTGLYILYEPPRIHFLYQRLLEKFPEQVKWFHLGKIFEHLVGASPNTPRGSICNFPPIIPSLINLLFWILQ